MLKDVLELRIMYPLTDQLLVGKDAEVRLNVLDALGRWCRCAADCRQRPVLEDPAKNSSSLGHPFGAVRKTVDACTQHAGERIGDADVYDLPCRTPVIVLLDDVFGVDQRPDDLLHEERITLCL